MREENPQMLKPMEIAPAAFWTAFVIFGIIVNIAG
jgi:hypothetical protein